MIAVAIVQREGSERPTLASTVVTWSGIDGSPLGATWSHSNLFGPDGVNQLKDEDSLAAKTKFYYPSSLDKFDFAKYAINDSTIAFGVRSSTLEAYAGGGGRFQVLSLFAIVNGQLSVIFSEPINYMKDVAGNWNKDGTRDHEEFEGENIVTISTVKSDGYFNLIVKSKNEPWRKTFRWNKDLLRYAAENK